MSLAPAWRAPLALLVALLLVAGWAQAEAVAGMAGLWWRSDTYAHGMLVPLISIWLAWRQRAQLAALAPRPWWPALLPLAGAVLAALLGQLAEVNALQHFAVLFTLQALVLLVLGAQVGRVIAFPLAFLVFAVPFGDFLVQPMMVHTADFVVAALRVLGIPVFREGLQFMIPSGPWSVVEACSGLRYLFASAMVGTLYAYLSFRSLRGRLIFMLVSLLVPVIANWVRALLIVLLGHYSDNRIATGADHLIYGWVFFGFIMMLMFWIGNRWADAPLNVEAATPVSLPAAAKLPLAAPLLALVLLVAPALLLHQLRPSGAEPQAPAGLLDGLQLPGWTAAERAEQLWKPIFLGAPLHQPSAWRSDTATVLLDIAVYPRQQPDAKAVNSMNAMVPAEDARFASRGSSDGVSRWTLRDGSALGSNIVARRLYWVDGHFTASDAQAKLFGLRQLLAGRGDLQVAIVVMTEEKDDGAARLDAFLQALQAP